MIKAIIDQLKTGSITAVYPRGEARVIQERPYVVVWYDTGIEQDDRRGIDEIYVAVHHSPGFMNIVDDYITDEVVTLLHKVDLLDRFGNNFRLEAARTPSPLTELNDDGTISQDRIFTFPNIFLG